MNGKKAKALRRAAATTAAARRPNSFWTSWTAVAVGAAVVAIVGASFVLPGALREQSSVAPTARHGHDTMATTRGDGLDVGTAVPRFSEQNVETGTAITAKSIRHKKTLLFFSEGVMCQACFDQIKGLERMQAQLDERGIQLISITPDRATDLKQAIDQYGIATPMIADSDRDMSAAFDTLGQGMHADTPGHAFALVDRGKIVWYHDYWLAPDRTMYVEPAEVLADLPA